MKILITTPYFAPSVGGIETVGNLLAEQFSALGNEVRILTLSRGNLAAKTNFKIIRSPSFYQILSSFFWADVVLQSHPSVRLDWPLLLFRKISVVIHHGLLSLASGSALRRYLLKTLCVRSRNVAVSLYVANSLPFPATVMLNPITHSSLFTAKTAERTADIVFLGRLVNEKKVEVLISAISVLHAMGKACRLTIIGSGPELVRLKQLVCELDLIQSVDFRGTIVGNALQDLLASHRILAIPSENEPFGLVALEGIAAGLVPVGSNSGGLPEAIGDCGVLFPPNDSFALADLISKLLESEEIREKYKSSATAHLMKHDKTVVAKRYLDIFSEEMANQ